jgi:ectoine hydroxylase-related dioxygenase (phytanoyl-CoA dioxygenase family)
LREDAGVTVPRFAPDTPPERLAQALKEAGCCIVEDRAGTDLLERFEAEMRPWLDRTPAGSEDFSGTRTRRTGALVARSPAARELVMDPLVLATADATLPERTALQLHLTQVIAIGPGETAQPVHRDQWAWDFFPFPAGFDVQCNTIWALTDFTEENGATRVVPGSNHWDDKLRIPYEDTEPAEMGRGSVLLYTGSVYHGGGANRSAAVRTGINITYCLGWLRQEENQYLSCPPEVARSLPKDLLRLMGYGRGAYALGYVDDLRDALDVLLGDDALHGGAGQPAQGFGADTVVPGLGGEQPG